MNLIVQPLGAQARTLYDLISLQTSMAGTLRLLIE